MNNGVYMFKRFEDSSLEYTGINKHSDDENVGLFSTTITRDDYEALALNQRQSMEMPSFTPGKLMKVKVKQYTKAELSKKKEVFIEQNADARHSDKPFSHNSNVRVGSAVEHGRFGEEVVSSLNLHAGKIQIVFKDGAKVFQFPKAFKQGFLKEVHK